MVLYRFSAYWLRSKCSICSYQFNIWYVLHRGTSILIWFLTLGKMFWACSNFATGWPGIAVPPGTAHLFPKKKMKPKLSTKRGPIIPVVSFPSHHMQHYMLCWLVKWNILVSLEICLCFLIWIKPYVYTVYVHVYIIFVVPVNVYIVKLCEPVD